MPEAPTSAPLTIRTLLCRTKPVAAAASPVNAFRSEITTGMSAPPIGSTKSTPNTAAAATSPQSASSLSTPAAIATPSAIAEPTTSAFPTFCAGYTMGRPLSSS